MIKTINLNGSEMKITELGGDNTEIFNNSNSVVYASKLPNITVGGDEVIAIPAGAIDGLYGTHGTVYLLGTGSVELRGIDHKVTESRVSASGTGVSSSYVDEKCNEILENANAYAAVKDSEMLVSAKEYADSLNAELTGYIGYMDSDIYGLEADFENCVFTRLAGAVGKEAGADFDSMNAYGGRHRCNLSDSGEVLAYYGDENFKADGSNGQVMVEQPKFYYRVVPLKTEKIDGTDGYHLRKARYYISDTPKAGFKVHPAFVRNGVEIDKIYLSAFEGSIYDDSAEKYLLENEQTADFNNDKLSSIANVLPCFGTEQELTRTNLRKLAHNRGVGWETETIQTVSAVQLLFVIEYGGFNSQTLLSAGMIKHSGHRTGSTLPLENMSDTVDIADNERAFTYRGEENLWGNSGRFIDGINVLNPDKFNETKNSGKICIADSCLSDDVFNGSYKSIDIPAVYGAGYISYFGYSSEYDWLFIPVILDGNDCLPVGDRYLNRRSGGRVTVMFGIGTNEGGLFFINFGLSSSYHADILGARLTYSPHK